MVEGNGPRESEGRVVLVGVELRSLEDEGEGLVVDDLLPVVDVVDFNFDLDVVVVVVVEVVV